MRSRNATALPRLVMSFDDLLFSRPLEQAVNGCWCETCLKLVDYEETVEEWRGSRRNGIRIRVRCHGQEEVGDFEFGSSDWDESDEQRAMQRRKWFNPHAGIGNERPGDGR